MNNQRDGEFWAAAAKKLGALNKPFYIWGAGVHTSQLLDHIPSCKPNILGIVDSDKQKVGQVIAGHTVLSPNVYLESYWRECPPIVISSYTNEREIYHELLEHEVPEAMCIRLYS